MIAWQDSWSSLVVDDEFCCIYKMAKPMKLLMLG